MLRYRKSLTCTPGTACRKLRTLEHKNSKHHYMRFATTFKHWNYSHFILSRKKEEGLQNPRNVRRSIIAAVVISATLLHEHAHYMIKVTYSIRYNKLRYPSTYTESRRSFMSSELSTVLSARTLAEELILVPIWSISVWTLEGRKTSSTPTSLAEAIKSDTALSLSTVVSAWFTTYSKVSVVLLWNLSWAVYRTTHPILWPTNSALVSS